MCVDKRVNKMELEVGIGSRDFCTNSQTFSCTRHAVERIDCRNACVVEARLKQQDGRQKRKQTNTWTPTLIIINFIAKYSCHTNRKYTLPLSFPLSAHHNCVLEGERDGETCTSTLLSIDV